jgi:translation initiation factor 2D
MPLQVYALALVPTLLPCIHTWPEVSGKVLGGADLFLQGVLQPPGGLPDFLAGSARSLAVPGNPIPFAVGKMAVSKQEALREGMKGRGLTLLHCYGDLLWQMGDKAAPNEGFTASRINPTEAAEAEAAGAAQEGDDAAAAAGAAAAREPGAAAAAAGAATQLGSLQLTEEGGNSSVKPAEGVAAAGTSNGGDAAAAAAIDMDALLEAAVLAGLQNLKTADLPIQTSDFYTKHMLPAKPEGKA